MGSEKNLPLAPCFTAKMASSGWRIPLTIIGRFVIVFNQEIPSQVKVGSRNLGSKLGSE